MEPLPRIDFVELHDLDGTPPVLRTESIVTIYRLTNAARDYARPLSHALREGVHTSITLTDLRS